MSRKKEAEITEHRAGFAWRKFAILVCVVGGGAFVLMQRKPAVPAPAQGRPVQALASKERATSVTSVSQVQDDLNRKRVQFIKDRELGVMTLDLGPSGQTLILPLIVSPTKYWCQAGDLDTMRYASKKGDENDFVIALERLGQKGGSAFVRTSLNQLSQGLTFSFKIPRPSEAALYGLSICQDSEQSNSCEGKKVLAHGALSDRLAQNPNPVQRQDQAFYFQSLVIDKKSIEIYRMDDQGSRFQKTLDGRLSEKGIDAAQIRRSWEMNTLLKSLPLAIQERSLVIKLAYNDPTCVNGLKSP